MQRAANIGLKPWEFWKMTPIEFHRMSKGFNFSKGIEMSALGIKTDEQEEAELSGLLDKANAGKWVS